MPDIDGAGNGPNLRQYLPPALPTRGTLILRPYTDEPVWHNLVMGHLSSDPLPVGAAAPGFSLRRTFEETVELVDLLERGPVAVIFYVFDFGNI